MKYEIQKDGSYHLYFEKLHIKNVFPSVDGIPVRPVNLLQNSHSIIYELAQGRLTLRFQKEADRLIILTDTSEMCFHDIQPLGNGVIESGDSCFVQGFGMGGPSGYHPFDEAERTSYGVTALKDEAGLAVGMMTDDYRHYTTTFRYRPGTLANGQFGHYLSASINVESVERERYNLPAIVFLESSDLAAVLKKMAEEIAADMKARHTQPPAYHWCSWYYLYDTMTQKDLEEYLEGMKDETFKYIQIDAGYSPSLGDWLLPNARYPEGLKKAADTICRYGFGAGVWVGVFMVGDHSTLFREHPDWMLRKADGSLWVELRDYNEPKAWGNPDCNYFVLDTSHPEALAYIGQVFSTLRDWGFTLFKTDFMLWSMKDGRDVRRYNPSKTSVEIFRETLQTIRDAIGEESYWLGCIAPFMPFIGYADGMRIASDVGAQWEGAYGPRNMIREVKADNYFNHIFWQNDPDSVLLRDFDIFLTPMEVEGLALLQGLSGGVVTTSDPVFAIAPERKRLLKMIRPDGNRHSATFPYAAEERSDLVITHTTDSGKLLYALNTSAALLTVVYEFGELFDQDTYCVCRWKNQEETLPEDSCSVCSMYIGRLQPHESVLLFLTEKPLVKKPENLWTFS